MWSKKPMPVSMSVFPVPSRQMVTSMSVSFVVLLIVAFLSISVLRLLVLKADFDGIGMCRQVLRLGKGLNVRVYLLKGLP